MTSLHHNLSIALRAAALLIATAAVAFAQSKPAMETVILDMGKNQIEVKGTSFGNALPTLALNSTNTSIISHTPERILAELPMQDAGHYTLTLTNHDATANNQATFSFDVDDSKEETAPPPAVRSAAAPPPGFTVATWQNNSDQCDPDYACSFITPGIPPGTILISGGCGAYYDAYSVYMYNSSPDFNLLQWKCGVVNTDSVNNHTIVLWLLYAGGNGSAAAGSPIGPVLLIKHPLNK